MKKSLVIASCITMLALGYTNVKVYAATEEPVIGITTVLDRVDPIEIKSALNITYMWSTEKVNLRKEASINSDRILTLEKRTKLQKITSSNGWTNVKYNGEVGWVKSEYLRDTELPSLDFTDEEIDLLAKIVWIEARGEEDDSIAATVIVIKNRILSLEFSDTIFQVLSDKNGDCYEFSSWKLLNTAKIDTRILEIIDEVLNGEWDGLLDEDYVYFSTSPRNNHGTIKIGNHFFCKY